MPLKAIEQRGAVRLPLTAPVQATLAHASARIVVISLIGCRAEHEPTMQVGTTASLELVWRGQTTPLLVTVARSEFCVVEGRSFYASGLRFCPTIFDSPEPVPSIIAASVQKVGHLTPRPASRADGAAAPYIECSLDEATWTKTPVWTPGQPREGFTMPTPASSADLDRFCRAYQRGAADVRRQLRAAAELAIVREGRS